MSDLLVRRATSADAEAVRGLTRSAYARWVPLIGREPRPMTADYDRATLAHMIDLVEKDGHLAGLIEMSAETDHLMIINIAVHPDGQGRRLGSRFLQHAEAVARELGLSEMRLYTNAGMERNIALYRSRGYVETSREPAGELGTVVNMSKQLGPIS